MLGSAGIFYNTVVLEEMLETLVGIDVVAKGDDVPAGAQQVTRDELLKLKGKAKVGGKGQPIPRETGETQRKVTLIPEHSHGFRIHRKDLQASQRTGQRLPDASAKQSARLVAESMEDMIFNGVPELEIKGIYADAGSTYTVESDYEWNKDKAEPFNDMVKAFAQLESNGKYTGRKLILSPTAYRTAFKTNTLGISYMSQIAGLFPNGMADIVKAPQTANGNSTIIPVDGGVLCDFGKGVAERYVEEDVNVQGDFPMNEDNLFPFNVLTYQSIDIHRVEAFLKLDNLIDTTP